MNPSTATDMSTPMDTFQFNPENICYADGSTWGENSPFDQQLNFCFAENSVNEFTDLSWVSSVDIITPGSTQNLKVGSLDPHGAWHTGLVDGFLSSTAARKERRREQNRRSQKAFRDRQISIRQWLEDQVALYKSRAAFLLKSTESQSSEIQRLQAEVERLQKLVDGLGLEATAARPSKSM
jgi:hypothetical protein